MIVNPYDKVEVCDAVQQALDMARAERAERWAGLSKGLEINDLAAWRNDFLTALASATAHHPE